jgi:site-specific DNA recombinase
MKQTAIGYVRVSTMEQATEGVSLDAQREAIEAYCKLRGFELVAIVDDAGVSAGKALSTRPGGEALLSTLARKEAAHVVAYKLDRLFRDAADCLDQTAQWDKRGVALHLIDMGGQAIDTSTAMGRFFLTVMAGAAEMERNLVRERTRAAMAHKRDRGERISGKAPFGCRFEGGMVVKCEKEQSILTDIQALRADGLSYQKIANELTRRGVWTRGGKGYSKQGIAQLLKVVA